MARSKVTQQTSPAQLEQREIVDARRQPNFITTLSRRGLVLPSQPAEIQRSGDVRVEDVSPRSIPTIKLSNVDRPYFKAKLTSPHLDVTGNGETWTVLFNSEVQDDLGNYDPSTGIFTCEQEGIYLFSAGLILSFDSAPVTPSDAEMWILPTSAAFTARFPFMRNLDSQTSAFEWGSVGSIPLPLEVGDTVRVVAFVDGTAATDGSILADERTFFSGVLLG